MVIRHSDLLECKFLSRYCPQRAMRICSPEAGGQCGSQEVDLKLAVSVLTPGPCVPQEVARVEQMIRERELAKFCAAIFRV